MPPVIHTYKSGKITISGKYRLEMGQLWPILNHCSLIHLERCVELWAPSIIHMPCIKDIILATSTECTYNCKVL